MSAANVDMAESMRKYHEYLEKNYDGGRERFFSPTGFLEKFQRTVKVKSDKARNHVFVRDVDDAAKKLEEAIAGQQGVFDLTAEPGTGKTSVLPFRFPSKKVVVALPTPFDAWNAFNMATGKCGLRIKGLRLGDQQAGVIYTDSYMAACALMSNFIEYDIMIVDECDSDRGCSKFLADVKTKGKLLIRMSASHGKQQAGLSRSFRVTESQDMPDVRDGKRAVADFVLARPHDRALVLAPDARTAAELAALIPDSVLVTTETDFEKLAVTMVDQTGKGLFVSDDTCGRALNLNLDAMFDCQLVVEYSNVRVLTPTELYQRMGRVGRNREGWYYSPGLNPKKKDSSDFDILRHNVVRSYAEVEQEGDKRLHISDLEVEELLCSKVEPYQRKMAMNAMQTVAVSSRSASPESDQGYSTPALERSMSTVSINSYSEPIKVQAPAWLPYFVGGDTSGGEKGRRGLVDTFVISNSRGEKAFQRRKSSDSSSGKSSDRSISSIVASSFKGSSVVSNRAAPFLPVAKNAPYAVDRPSREKYRPQMDLPSAPPVMDLTDLTYDLDWPSLVRDRLSRGGDLPQIVPYGSWRHTSAGGLGTDWFARLDQIAVADMSFSDTEFEVICRAWNKLCAQAWIKRTPGLSNASDAQRLEFCVRYFQSYFSIGSVG